MDFGPSGSSSLNNMARRWARRIERCCCTCVTYFPLPFVYGLTTWALWIDIAIGSAPSSKVSWIGTGSSIGAFVIWALLNWSYTTAVFTDPGGTTNSQGYAELPTQEPPAATSFTVKSNGEIRFCKKCQARKPDRAHHCSSCKRCILKMDHHCPWLASCIGLRNYKPFLLFLIYTTLLCFYSFAISGSWTYAEIVNNTTYVDNILPINFIILSVISGIIGIVVGAFTAWHIMLASRGQTTIECLEKTRYLSPIRKQLESHNIRGMPIPHYGQQLLGMHANALPGITGPEEGEEHRGPRSTASTRVGLDGQRPAHFSYDDMERERARRRYEDYLDEQDSDKLPSAFNLGVKRNLRHLFGPSPLLWFIPICNTIGDGWSWEASPKWLATRDRIRSEREQQRAREINAGWGAEEAPPQFLRPNPPPSSGAGRHYLGVSSPSPASPAPSSPGPRTPSKADRVLGRDANLYADAVPMQKLSPRHRNLEEELEVTDDEDDYFGESAATEDAAAAENRAMNLVTNGGWGRGGASGLLRKHSDNSGNSGKKGSPNTISGGGGPQGKSPDDETVD